jgi:hypothetical protein
MDALKNALSYDQLLLANKNALEALQLTKEMAKKIQINDKQIATNF